MHPATCASRYTFATSCVPNRPSSILLLDHCRILCFAVSYTYMDIVHRPLDRHRPLDVRSRRLRASAGATGTAVSTQRLGGGGLGAALAPIAAATSDHVGDGLLDLDRFELVDAVFVTTMSCSVATFAGDHGRRRPGRPLLRRRQRPTGRSRALALADDQADGGRLARGQRLDWSRHRLRDGRPGARDRRKFGVPRGPRRRRHRRHPGRRPSPPPTRRRPAASPTVAALRTSRPGCRWSSERRSVALARSAQRRRSAAGSPRRSRRRHWCRRCTPVSSTVRPSSSSAGTRSSGATSTAITIAAVLAAVAGIVLGMAVGRTRPDVKRARRGRRSHRWGSWCCRCSPASSDPQWCILMAHGAFKSSLFLGAGSGLDDGGHRHPRSARPTAAVLACAGATASGIVALGLALVRPHFLDHPAAVLPVAFAGVVRFTVAQWWPGRRRCRGKVDLADPGRGARIHR